MTETAAIERTTENGGSGWRPTPPRIRALVALSALVGFSLGLSQLVRTYGNLAAGFDPALDLLVFGLLVIGILVALAALSVVVVNLIVCASSALWKSRLRCWFP